MKLAPYSAYKDSGVPWLGKVPAHWEVKPGMAFISQRKEKNIGMKESTVLSLSYGQIVVKPPEKLHGLVPESFETYQIIDTGNIIIRGTDLQNDKTSLRVGKVRNRGIITSAYLCLQVNEKINPDYTYLILHVYDVMKVYYGMGSGLRQSLDFSNFKRLPILVPSSTEQSIIQKYVKSIDVQINRFIRNKQRLIELLKEQKQAIINQAVTRGLDPDVKLKPSGVEWLGDIPAHWEVRRIRACIENYEAGIWGEDPDSKNSDEHIVCIRVADFDIRNLSISQDKLTTRAVPQKSQKTRLLKAGDILMEKSGGGDTEPVGRVVYFDFDFPAVTSNFVTRLRPYSSVVKPRFLLFVLAILQATRRNVPSIKQTTGIQNLDERHYLSNYVGLPALEEQDAIVEHIDTKSAEINQAIARTQREIELIREYRTRLISDVVTGQVDVRGIALPEVAEEELLVLEEDTAAADDLTDDEEVMDETD